MITSMATHNHFSKVNTTMHRSTIVELEDDRACADEGSGRYCCDQRCSQGRDCPVRPIKSLEEAFPLMWMAYGLAIVLTVGVCALLVELA